MSTLKANTFANTSGVPYYPAACMVTLNGTGSISITGSDGISSITDNSTGEYYVDFSNAFGNTNYHMTASARDNSSIGSGRPKVFAMRGYTDSTFTTSREMIALGQSNEAQEIDSTKVTGVWLKDF